MTVLYREIPDPKQRRVYWHNFETEETFRFRVYQQDEVLTPAFTGRGCQLCPLGSCICFALNSLEAWPENSPLWKPASPEFTCFCLFQYVVGVLFSVTLQSPSIYPNLHQKRDLDGNGLHLFQHFFSSTKLQKCRFLLIWYSCFYWIETPRKQILKLQRTWKLHR